MTVIMCTIKSVPRSYFAQKTDNEGVLVLDGHRLIVTAEKPLPGKKFCEYFDFEMMFNPDFRLYVYNLERTLGSIEFRKEEKISKRIKLEYMKEYRDFVNTLIDLNKELKDFLILPEKLCGKKDIAKNVSLKVLDKVLKF